MPNDIISSFIGAFLAGLLYGFLIWLVSDWGFGWEPGYWQCFWLGFVMSVAEDRVAHAVYNGTKKAIEDSKSIS